MILFVHLNRLTTSGFAGATARCNFLTALVEVIEIPHLGIVSFSRAAVLELWFLLDHTAPISPLTKPAQISCSSSAKFRSPRASESLSEWLPWTSRGCRTGGVTKRAAALDPSVRSHSRSGSWLRTPPFASCPPQLIVNDKSQNLRRLQAQRNELNAKGEGEGGDLPEVRLLGISMQHL